jgi:hypothetical protein
MNVSMSSRDTSQWVTNRDAYSICVRIKYGLVMTADKHRPDRRTEWWADEDELIAFARVLVEADQLGDAHRVIDSSASRGGGPLRTESGASWVDQTATGSRTFTR